METKQLAFGCAGALICYVLYTKFSKPQSGKSNEESAAKPAKNAKKKKKVLISGCFDLLHSGHVEFFREAAKYGDLYVRLGSSKNIKMLKNHDTMYTDAERLFMVQNIKGVHDAAISLGSGRYDFESDMAIVKPDIYVCNDDASAMPGRVKICERLDIEMVVLERKPAEGLEVRSSTSMKARLTAMLKGAAAHPLTNPVSDYHSVVPWRLCFAGGWMDLKWCNELYPGSVITINFKHHPAIACDYCGLATSTRKVWIKLWNGEVPKYLQAGEAARFLYGSENFGHFAKYKGGMPEWEKTSYSAGSQDHCGLTFPGIVKLNYEGAHWPSSMLCLNDPSDPKQAEIFAWLERVLHIIKVPFESRPGDYNSQRINNLTDTSIPRERRVAMAKAIADASELAWKGIVSMDSQALGKGLSDTMKAWEVALPYTVDPFQGHDAKQSAALREWWTQYDAPHTRGCLFSGAGGGFLFVISDTPIEGALKIKINNDHIFQPFESDNLDSQPHPVPFS